ncbi:unnamed protein product [Tenebrio molitor]|nr:unnamed protein product [Tenebrio molitor]
MFRNVCRLCMGTEDLMWIFSDKMPDNMRDIIKITSGVEINKTDRVTQMVCNTCCQITIKMYKFRTSSMKNDRDLKTKCSDHNFPQLTPHTSVPCKKDSIPTSCTSYKGVMVKNPVHITYKFAHPSVKDVVKKYPNIILPKSCLKSHIGAYITLVTEEVDDWFKERNFTESQIAKLKREACEVVSKSPKRQRKQPREDRKQQTIITSDAKEVDVTAGNASKTREASTVVNSKRRDVASPVNPSKRIKLTGDDCSKITTLKVEKAQSESVFKKSEDTSVKSTFNTNVQPIVISSGTSGAKPEVTSNCSESVKSTLNDSVISTRNTDGTSTCDKSIDSVVDSSDKSTPNSDVVSLPDNESSQDERVWANKDNSCVDNSLKSTDGTANGKNNVEAHAEASVCGPLVSLLESLLVSGENTSKPTESEDITLKSILGCEVLVDEIKCEDNNTIEITENAIPDPLKKKDQPPDTFTSRPFTPDISSEQTPSNQTVAVHAIVPESEDGQDRTVDSGSDTDELVMDLDCASSSASSTRSDDKTSSETKSSESSNMPDLSLVSVANKFYTLYTCKVCDSQHNSLKDLKHHERKTHTKCPFCRKRFRTLAIREEHILYSCPKKSTRQPMKKLKILLVRVDQDQDIRQKYPGAFDEEEDVPHVIEVEGPNEKSVVECDPDTAKAVRDMEKFLQFVEDLKEDNKQKDETASGSGDDAKSVQEGAKEEVICISDEETDIAKSEPEGSQRKIKVVNTEFLQNTSPDGNDVNMLKRVLRSTKWKMYESMRLNNNSIVDGGSNRVKIFKNLRKHLHCYKIPIEVKYNVSVLVEYKPAKASVPKKTKDLWHSMTPQQLKKPNERTPDPPKEKPSTNARRPILLKKTMKDYTRQKAQFTVSTSTSDKVPIANLRQAPRVSPAVPKNTTTTTNLILSSGSIMTATANGNYTSNASLILNGSANGTNFANIILVPGTLIPKKMTVPVTQGSLPVLQTVSSAGCSNTLQLQVPTSNNLQTVTSLATFNTFSNALMSVAQTVNNGVVTVSNATMPVTNVDQHEKATDSSATQPAIRVKNLSELS